MTSLVQVGPEGDDEAMQRRDISRMLKCSSSVRRPNDFPEADVNATSIASASRPLHSTSGRVFAVCAQSVGRLTEVDPQARDTIDATADESARAARGHLTRHKLSHG